MNFGTMWFMFWSRGVAIFAMGVIILFLSSINTRKHPRNKRDMMLGVIGIGIGLCLSYEYIHRINNPEIGEYTGQYVEWHRDGAYYLYRFTSQNNGNMSFKLDRYTKNEMEEMPFIENNTYTIFYERDSKSILRIEHKDID